MQETALPRYNGLTLQHHHSPVVSVGIDVVSPITDALRTGYTCFELKFLFITLYFCTGMCWRVVVCTQVKGHLCGFIWLPVWPCLPIMWGSTPLQNLSIPVISSAIPLFPKFKVASHLLRFVRETWRRNLFSWSNLVPTINWTTAPTCKSHLEHSWHSE